MELGRDYALPHSPARLHFPHEVGRTELTLNPKLPPSPSPPEAPTSSYFPKVHFWGVSGFRFWGFRH